MKNAGRIIAFFVTLLAAVIAVCGCGMSSPDELLIGAYLEANVTELGQPAGDDDTPITFIVEPGETAAEIATRLKRVRLISDAELFRRYAQYHDLDAGIEAGEFTLRQTMTIPEIARALQQGRRQEQTVTVQEGWRLEQVAAAVAAQTTIPEDEFLVLVSGDWRDTDLASYTFLADLPPTATLEGFLFPETYNLPEEPVAIDLLSRMLETFDARVTPEMQTAAANQGLSVYELVTLASIVEREVVLNEESTVIAGVYHNRLEAGWFLGACPTVQYALGSSDTSTGLSTSTSTGLSTSTSTGLGTSNWWPPFTLEATDADSPYNTYRHLGLPPGPICSPGLASIQAAAYPADTDYFFFLANCTQNDGSHLFAVTQEEHLRNYEACGGEIP